MRILFQISGKEITTRFAARGAFCALDLTPDLEPKPCAPGQCPASPPGVASPQDVSGRRNFTSFYLTATAYCNTSDRGRLINYSPVN